MYSLHFSHSFVFAPAACLCWLTQLLLLAQTSEIPRATFHQLLRATVLCCLRPAPLMVVKHCTPAQWNTYIWEKQVYRWELHQQKWNFRVTMQSFKACADTAGNNFLRSASGQKVPHEPPHIIDYLLGATISYCTETVLAFLAWTNWMGFSPQEQN